MDQFKAEHKAKQVAEKADEINLLNMIESRIMEILKIEEECERKLPKLFQQRLPRFMRRRAASHNVKRLPTRLRPKTPSSAKSRKTLLKYRRRLRYRKHKRVLKKHARHKYKDPDKSVLHKWFAKRFKMGQEAHLSNVPIYNNTKNQRNLYRQTRFGCAYLSYTHLTAIMLTLSPANDQEGSLLSNQLSQLCRLTCSVSGFTFQAKSLQEGRYEVVIHLFKLDAAPNNYLCPSYVSLQSPADKTLGSQLLMWIPREYLVEILGYLNTIANSSAKPFKINPIEPRMRTRIRLVGPNSREEAFKICVDETASKQAAHQATMRIHSSLGATLARYVEEQSASFTYYATSPLAVDITFKGPEGRMLWHQLIKNKAHLVGGYRDLARVLVQNCFKLIPDHHKYELNKSI